MLYDIVGVRIGIRQLEALSGRAMMRSIAARWIASLRSP
jgi:hypothetical protein